MSRISDTFSVIRNRWRFRRGLIGYWSSRAGGGGFDMVHWFAMQFDKDGRGMVWRSSFPGDPGYEPAEKVSFEWRPIGIRRIEIRAGNEKEWNAISYDFVVRHNEYGIAEICVEQAGQIGFWLSPYPMARDDRPPSSFAI